MRNTGSHISNNTYHSNEIRGGEKKVMKKSLSVILSTTMALSAFSTAALAATSKDFSDLKDLSAADKAIFDKLIEDGIFLGVGEDKFGIDEAMKRDQFAVAISKALKLTADATTSTFPDVKEDAPELRFIEAAYKAGVANGNKDGTFNPKGEVSVQELAVFLVGALGPKYKEEARAATGDFEGVAPWAQGYVTTALKYNLLAVDVEEGFDGFASATRFQLAKGVAAVQAQVAKDQQATKVESVTANNLKEIVVTFDGQVKEEEAEKITNYKLDGVTLTNVSFANLQDDGRTVVINLGKEGSTLTNQKEHKVTISGISNIASAEYSFTALDVTVPEVSSIEILGNKVINVKFSEPVKPSSAETRVNYKVNGYVANGEIELSKDGKTATITLYSRLKAGINKVSVSGVQDYANMTIINVLDREIEVADDTTAPASFSIEAATLDAVTVKFDEAVDKDTIKKDNIYWSDNAGTVKHHATAVEPTDTTFTTYEITFGDTKLPARETTLYIESVSDLFGNTASKLSSTVNATVDTTRPEITSLEVYTDDRGNYNADSKSKFDIKFNKAISTSQFGGANAENLIVKDKDGKIVAVSASATQKSGHKNTLTVTLSDPLDEGATYTVEVKNVEDGTALHNKMIPQTFTVTVPEVTAPAVTNVAVVSAGDQGTKIQVVFTNAMALEGEYSILKSDRYMIKVGASWYMLPGGTTFQPTYDSKAVIITIPADAKYDGINVLTANLIEGVKVTLVADRNGNKLSGLTDEILNDGAKWGAITSSIVDAINDDRAIATATDKIKLTFDRPLQVVYASDFLVSVNGGAAVEASSASYETKGGKGVVTLTLPSNNKVSSAVNATVTTRAAADLRSLDLLGNKIKDSQTVTVQDGIAPGLSKAYNGGANAVWATSQNVVSIAFDETLSSSFAGDPNVLAGMFTVKTGLNQSTTLIPGTDYTAAIVNGNVVELTLTKQISNVGKLTVASNDAAMYIFDENAFNLTGGYTYANKVKFGATAVGNPSFINVGAANEAAALTALNNALDTSNTATVAQYVAAGITGVNADNLAVVNAAAEAAKVAKAAALTASEIQAQVNAVVAAAKDAYNTAEAAVAAFENLLLNADTTIAYAKAENGADANAKIAAAQAAGASGTAALSERVTAKQDLVAEAATVSVVEVEDKITTVGNSATMTVVLKNANGVVLSSAAGTVTYAWTVVSAPENGDVADITATNETTASVNLAADATAETGDYEVKVVVTQGANSPLSKTAKLTVN